MDDRMDHGTRKYHLLSVNSTLAMLSSIAIHDHYL